MPNATIVLHDAVLLDYERHLDSRGYFANVFAQQWTALTDFKVVQINQSYSHAYVFRGMHLQRPPYAQAKLIQVLQGAIVDFIVDLRPDSPCYKQLAQVRLEADNPHLLFVPEGFAHGFLSLKNNTLVQYLVNAPYAPEFEKSLSYQALGLDKHLKKYLPKNTATILSPKDHAP